MPRHQNKKNRSLKDSNFDHLEYVTSAQVEIGLASGAFQFQCRKCKAISESNQCVSRDDKHWFDLILAPPETTQSDPSIPTITVSEMRVNAGLHSNPFYIRAVRRKVRVYGGLNKAELCGLGAVLVARPALV